MELDILTEFSVLARHLNFSKAAQELNLTQPTLSRHIAQLEEALEVSLFRRDRQSVSLTDAGVLFLPEADAVCSRFHAALKKVRDFRDDMAGTLSVGYRWVYGVDLWPQILHTFRAQHPQICVQAISFLDNDVLQSALRNDGLDISINLCGKNISDTAFQGVCLAQIPLLAVMPDSHPLSGQQAVTPTELVSHRLLVPQTRSSMGLPALMTTLFRHCGSPPLIYYSGEGLDDAFLRVQMEQVIALVPECYIPDKTISGVYVASVDGSHGMFQLMALARGTNPNPAAKLFLQLCRKNK